MARLVTGLMALGYGLAVAEEVHAPAPAPHPQPPVETAAPAPDQKPAKGYVLQVAGKLVYLDLGLRDNVRVGDTFEIIRDQEIVHPVTGENLGGKAPVGLVRVTQVFEKLSIAEIVSVIPGASVTRMDRVRMGNESLEPPPPPPPAASVVEAPPPATASAPPHEHALVHTPDGVVGGIDLGLGGAYEMKEKGKTMGAEALFPLSRRFAVGGGYSRGQESHDLPPAKLTATEEEVEGRVRVYLKRLLRGGEDINPDGEVGAVALDLGGGVRTLKATTVTPVIVSIDTTRTPPDTTRGTSTATVKTSENGLNFGAILPLGRKMTLGLTYDWAKHTGRMGGWFRTYTGAIDPDWEGANPDGKIGSLVITLFGSYDSKSAGVKKWFGADFKVPLSRMLTFSLAYGTNQKLRRISGGLNIHIEKKLLR